jgi:hypothetical protein
MKIKQTLAYALVGWVAGVITALVVGLLWPTIFPAVIRIQHYYGTGPSLLLIIAIVLIYASPAALIGGMLGGWVPREGGRADQFLLAAIFGALLALPFGCYGMWFFTGW